jgi:hypothetical protein
MPPSQWNVVGPLLAKCPVASSMCENFHSRVNIKINRRHGKRSAMLTVLRNAEFDDYHTFMA